MKYHSTRGKSELYDSAKTVAMGLAPDGGLFVPENFPTLDAEGLIGKPYHEIANIVLSLFLTDYSSDFLSTVTKEVYGTDRYNKKEGEVKIINDALSFIELYHGPTAAFKDYALQMLPRLLVESKRMSGDRKSTVIFVATSGDTGSAALCGFKGVDGTKVMVFYPHGGVSEVQEKQMLLSTDENAKTIAVEGNFDDTQTAVKEIFTSPDIARIVAENNATLSSANSMNFGRLVPQICYYFSSYAELVKNNKIAYGEPLDYVVPTGNFGDILAGYYAKRMGLPIGKLVCASNSNKILTDFFKTGVYDANREFFTTTSPSMDILISSNLERFLYHESGDCEYVASLMHDLKTTGRFEVRDELLSKMSESVFAGYATEEEAATAINSIAESDDYLIDTHTGVALYVANDWQKNPQAAKHVVVLSTASAYKFPQATHKAIFGGYAPTEKEATAKLAEKFSAIEKPLCISSLSDNVSFNRTVASIDDAKKQAEKFIFS